MKLRFIIIIASITLLISCQRGVKAKFEITNKTAIEIDSINVKSYDHESNSNYIKLASGQSQTYWLDMSNLPKVDGDYLLSYIDSTTKTIRFGYFTNGFPMEKVTKIEIKKDTLIIDQIYDNY